jgi:hypothetical protein
MLFLGQKKLFFQFHNTTCVNTALKDQEKSLPQTSLRALSQENFSVLSVPNKIPNIPNEKTFPNDD